MTVELTELKINCRQKKKKNTQTAIMIVHGQWACVDILIYYNGVQLVLPIIMINYCEHEIGHIRRVNRY